MSSGEWSVVGDVDAGGGEVCDSAEDGADCLLCVVEE